MMNKDKLFSVVKIIIDDWNPVMLLPHAPADEYDIETDKIVSKLYEEMTALGISEIIASVFSQSFSDSKFTIERCMKPANKIYEEIVSRN